MFKSNRNIFDEDNEFLINSHTLNSDSYLNYNNFIGKFHDNKTNLNIISINTGSLNAKIENLRILLQQIEINHGRVHIISIQETWDINTKNEHLLQLNNYKLFYNSRVGKRGGGVAIYVYKNLNSELMPELTLMKKLIFETIAIKIKIHNKTMIIGCFYRSCSQLSDISQNEQFDIFLKKFDNWIIKINNLNFPAYICFDSNLDLMKLSNERSMSFYSLFLTNGFVNLFTKPTRLNNNSETLIDNIITNSSLNTDSFQTIETFSDHNLLGLSIESQIIEKPSMIKEKRIMTQKSIRNFKTLLWEHDWSYLKDENIDIDNNVENFLISFNSLFNKAFELKSYKTKRKSICPYFTEKIKELQNIKNKALKKWKLTKEENHKLLFNKARNNLRRETRKVKQNFIKEKINKLQFKPKELWRFLSEQTGLGNNAKKENSTIECIRANGKMFYGKEQITDIFNNYFSSVAKKIISKISPQSSSFKDFLPPRKTKSFGFIPFSFSEIAQLIENLKNKQSCDIFGVSNKLVKQCAIELSIPLTMIINNSIQQGKFPTAFKKVKIIPVYKRKGDPTQLENYRPIAIIPIFAKILEISMNIRLTSFFNANNILSNFQFGYRTNLSVHSAVVTLLNRIGENIENKKYVGSLLLDCEKAFDTVDRSILLQKLENCGIRGSILNWFTSYLSDRKQLVEINGCIGTNEIESNYGVLQGSALSANLFIFYVNDLISHLNKKALLYADDVNIVEIASNRNDLDLKMNLTYNLANNWYQANKLSLNAGKTEYIVFEKSISPSLTKCSQSSNLDLSSSHLPEESSSVRYLGIHIDKKLKLEPFFKKIIQRISIGSHTLNRLKNFFPENIKCLLYNAFVHSHLEFCSIYLQMASKSDLKIITKIQKYAIRAVAGENSRAHTAHIFQRLKILPIDLLMRVNIFKFMRNEIFNNFTRSQNQWNTWTISTVTSSNYNLRSNNSLKEISGKLSRTKNLPLHNFPKVYNSIKLIYDQCDVNYKMKDLKDKLLADYVNKYKCNSTSCYICKEHETKLQKVKRELILKKQRTEELIILKGLKKKRRYAKLKEKACGM